MLSDGRQCHTVWPQQCILTQTQMCLPNLCIVDAIQYYCTHCINKHPNGSWCSIRVIAYGTNYNPEGWLKEHIMLTTSADVICLHLFAVSKHNKPNKSYFEAALQIS